MRARFALLVATITMLTALTPGVGGAHDTNSFEASAAFTARSRYWVSSTITVVRGDTVWLRAKAKPPHAGFEVILQKQNPGRTQWHDECTMPPPPGDPCYTLTDGGRVKTSWFAGSGSVDEDDPYHFRWKIPDHGISNTLNVWVFKP
jgi:hypothetical protein